MSAVPSRRDPAMRFCCMYATPASIRPARRVALTIDLRAGDMQFLNNRVTMHSRTGYVDHPEPERRRDLIRLWLTTGD
jgi:hypothetical protein